MTAYRLEAGDLRLVEIIAMIGIFDREVWGRYKTSARVKNGKDSHGIAQRKRF